MSEHPTQNPGLASARLIWDAEGRPLSQAYNDCYFSRLDGLEETRYVFLQHNGLPQRWSGRSTFTLAETGFGSGLNFLATWQLWRQHGPADARLNYISVEKHPLQPEDLARALALWPQLAPLSGELLQRYPLPCPGFHRLSFDQGRVRLTLIYGEASEGLAQLDARVDAWYLDGFAPAKNPDMWTDALFQQMARLSAAGATFSTFTAAGRVRRGLQAAGFTVDKVPGFGHKREMLRGSLALPQPAPAHWAQRPISPTPRHALVIGAGIAGATAARALAERGLTVEVLDRGPGPASGASGNPQGILYTKLPAQPTRESRIHLSGYLYSLRLLAELWGDDRRHWSPSGLLQLATDAQDEQRQAKLITEGHYPGSLLRAVDRSEASALAGTALSRGGLYFPQGGWVSPALLCDSLLSHPAIACRYHTPVDRLRRTADGQWVLLDAEGHALARAAAVVVANAADALHFEQLHDLPLKPIRGQTSRCSPPPECGLNTVLCGHGYIAPPIEGQFCFGATFDLHNDDPAVRLEDHDRNLEKIAELAPDLAQHLAAQPRETWQGRTGFRCTSPDYLPLVGAAVDSRAFIDCYGALRQDARALINTPPPHQEGLFVSLAHGSKGLTSAPLSAELLAALICDEPLPLERHLAQALNPARFLVKNLIRRTI